MAEAEKRKISFLESKDDESSTCWTRVRDVFGTLLRFFICSLSSDCHSEPFDNLRYEPRHEKTDVLVSDLVRNKPGCTATEDGKRLEISDLESREIVLSV